MTKKVALSAIAANASLIILPQFLVGSGYEELGLYLLIIIFLAQIAALFVMKRIWR